PERRRQVDDLEHTVRSHPARLRESGVRPPRPYEGEAVRDRPPRPGAGARGTGDPGPADRAREPRARHLGAPRRRGEAEADRGGDETLSNFGRAPGAASRNAFWRRAADAGNRAWLACEAAPFTP